MDLTPENKAIGKENFKAAIGSPVLRRSFLKEGIQKGIASGAGLGPYYFGYGESVSAPLRVGVIGTGDEGSVLIGAINPNFIEVKSIADIRPYSQFRAFHGDWYGEAFKVRCGLMAKYGWKTEDKARDHVKVYGRYQELLENAAADDVEAVIIALPLHLHAPAAIAAMKAGLHVLTEKLMGHSVRECKEMARVAKQTGMHLATGHQRHYNILYENAVKAIEAGLLGDLHYIRAQWHRGNMPGSDSWQQPMPEILKPDDVQAKKLDKDLESWKKKIVETEKKLAEATAKRDKDTEKIAELAKALEIWRHRVPQKEAQLSDSILAETAKQFGYEDAQIKDSAGTTVYDRPAAEELIRWRLWNRTGGGLMAELGSHQLDAASIFISAMHGGKKQYPLNVSAASGRPIFPPDRDTDDHVYCLFEFPAPDYDPKDELGKRKKISVAYASINGNGFGGYGETVFGTKGTLLLNLEKEALLYRTHSVNEKVKLTGSIGAPELTLNDKGDELSAAIGTQALTGDISRGYTEEEEHWAWCIRENPKNEDPEIHPRCEPKVALGDAVIALTTNMAARGPGRIDFDPEWFDPDSDKTPEDEKPDVSRYA
jgi:predicted dehydrogenase